MSQTINLNLSFTIDQLAFHIISLSNNTFYHPIPSHCHSTNSYEFHYVLKGHGTLVINDETTYSLQPNCLYVTGPMVQHAQIPNPVDPMREYGLYVHVHPVSSNAYSALFDAFLSSPFWIGQAPKKMAFLFDSIFETLHYADIGYLEEVSALLQQLLLHVIRQYSPVSSQKLPLPADKNLLSKLASQFLTIEENFLYHYADITLDKLALLLHLSHRQTQRLLKTHYGKTFNEKKTEARMSAAVSLLKYTSLTITTISEILGYSSAEHFCNAFKQYYSQSPSLYRKAH